MTFGWVILFPGTYSSQMPTELYVILFIIEQYQNSPCVPVTRNQDMPLYLIYPMKGILHFDKIISGDWARNDIVEGVYTIYVSLTVVSLDTKWVLQNALWIASVQKIFVKLSPQCKTCIQMLERKYSRILTGGSFWVMSLCMILIFFFILQEIEKIQ